MVDLRLRFRTLGALTGPIIATPLLLALTAASAAGVDEPIEAGATVLSADEARHADAEAYSARFDVSVEEALARLDQQSRLAEAAGSLEALEPERLAGAWIEHEPVFRLVVRFVGDDAGLDGAKATVGAMGVPVEYQFGAEHTLVELDEGEDALALLVAEKYPGMSMYADVRTGYVTLRGPEPVADSVLAELADIAGVPVKAEFAEGLVNQVGYGGRKIDTQLGGCTTGFSVVDAVSGLTGVLTAGHCAGSAGSVATYHDADGTLDSVTMSGKRLDSNQDFAWYQTPGADVPRFFDGQGGLRDVTGTVLRVNMSSGFVCHNGRTTGYSCGVNDTIRFRPEPELCGGQICSDRWAAIIDDPAIKCFSGDSGGPYFLNFTAWGVHKAGPDVGLGPGDCFTAVFMTAEQLTWDGVNTRIMLAN